MSAFSPRLAELVDALQTLPGVGPRSAQRMALHLLQRDRSAAHRLARALSSAAESVGRCADCGVLTEEERCAICRSDRRDRSVLCIVESTADVAALEQATDFAGLYFVLGGHLSPLDGVGPAELGLDRLEGRFGEGEVSEVILATGTTVEGEATAHYVFELAREAGVRATRIAHGVPVGGELERVDRGTLSHAFSGRREFG